MSACCGTEWPPRVALLAGGLATRLRPLTATVPKSLVPVAGEPFLGHQLRLLRSGGIREVVLCCGYLGEQIAAWAGDGSRFGLALQYSHDGARPLGTGGALRAALPLLGQRFLAMYGDSWLTEPLEPVWRAFEASRMPALMTVFRNENRWDRSNVELRDGRVTRYGKTLPLPTLHHIDYGLEALDSAVLSDWQATAFDLSEVLSALAEQGRLAAYEAADRFYEIGSPAGLRETEAVLRARTAAGSDLLCGPPPQRDAQAVCR